MPRKGPAVHREAEPDPVYQNVLVTPVSYTHLTLPTILRV